MHNLNLSMQSSLWTLFQLKSSKKRNVMIAFTLLPLITIFAFFIVDLVLQSIDYIQYFEVNLNGIKIDFIQSMFAYSAIKIVFIILFSIIHLLFVLPTIVKLIINANDFENSKKYCLAKHIKESYVENKKISSLLIAQFWVDWFWYLTYIIIMFVNFASLQVIRYTSDFNNNYPDQILYGINLVFSISLIIKFLIIDNLIPLIYNKKSQCTVINGNLANYLWLCITWISSFLFLIITTTAGTNLKLIHWVFIYSAPTIISPLLLIILYFAKATYIMVVNKNNRNIFTYLSAWLILFRCE
ncbi:hypothetical protein J8A71_02930 [Mycoplasmopsis agalactiae]|uniref:hypothetical protein n=1 Tax=Mycoplasmopsis agalactiae TaxID=2110 RepID=UPI001F18E91D|nr:hypothetical protein [Mycoplasmopsis agalactiae]MCE6061839.1 hypothetical protein [Mycoplasmopsis agalactiae]